MEELFYLMRKNDPLTIIRFDEMGHISDYSRDFAAPELMPFCRAGDRRGLAMWWEDRSVPVSQSGMQRYLQNLGYASSGQYLVKNLGLSLTDYYWLKPVDSSLSWEKVNLFSNAFKSDHLFTWPADSLSEKEISHYSPNGSLQGNIEKTWSILNGKRCLIKGNRGALSSQSLNEKIASEIYRLQGYDNYTAYHLLKINGAEYDYGCYSENFASERLEFIPAYNIVTSVKQKNDVSSYEHFISICRLHGIDAELLRADLELQILVDFIISGNDRHLNNLGILREADSLTFMRMAPVFDSGESFFCGVGAPADDKDFMSLKITSFASTEKALLEKVTDKKRLDISKLPPSSFIREMYEKDSHSNSDLPSKAAGWYEKKIDMLEKIQNGQNPFSYTKK